MKKLLASLILSSTLFGAPQAVVFDFGGVLTGEPNRGAVVQFIRESLRLSETEFEEANQEKRRALRSGKTDIEFWLQYGLNRGVALPLDWPEQFKSVIKQSIGVNPEMYDLVADLRAHQVKTGLLSNIDERVSRLIREFGLYEPFEPCLLSYEIGAEKPDLKAYAILVDRISCSPSEIVFIDDKAENVEAAKQAGLDAILFLSVDQIRHELRTRGVQL